MSWFASLRTWSTRIGVCIASWSLSRRMRKLSATISSSSSSNASRKWGRRLCVEGSRMRSIPERSSTMWIRLFRKLKILRSRFWGWLSWLNQGLDWWISPRKISTTYWISSWITKKLCSRSTRHYSLTALKTCSPQTTSSLVVWCMASVSVTSKWEGRVVAAQRQLLTSATKQARCRVQRKAFRHRTSQAQARLQLRSSDLIKRSLRDQLTSTFQSHRPAQASCGQMWAQLSRRCVISIYWISSTEIRCHQLENPSLNFDFKPRIFQQIFFLFKY